MKFHGGLPSRCDSVIKFGEASEVVLRAEVPDSRYPHPVANVPVHALSPRLIVFERTAIRVVLRISRNPQISYAVVAFIAVYVVDKTIRPSTMNV